MSESNGRRGGPVHKLTPEVHKILVEAIGKGMPRDHAARLARITERTLYNWLAAGRKAESGIEFQLVQDIKHAESACIDHCLTIINERAIDQWQAAAWLLERRHRKDFGKDSELSDQLRTLVKELEKARNALPA